jgi:hypothetical protein
MASDPVFLIGLALLVTAVVGGGVNLAGFEIPVLGGGARQVVAGALGVGLMLFAHDQHNFRVDGVALRALGNYAGPCPGQHRVEGRIHAKGGDGEVQYRIFGNGWISGEGRHLFTHEGTTGFEAVIPVAASGRYEMIARVTSPNDLDSVPVVYDAVCTNGSGQPPQTGSGERGYLGVHVRTVADGSGARVEQVQPGGPADRVGIAVGDVIRSVDGERIVRQEEVPAAVGRRSPGSTVSVELARGTGTLSLVVQLGSTGGVPGGP